MHACLTFKKMKWLEPHQLLAYVRVPKLMIVQSDPTF